MFVNFMFGVLLIIFCVLIVTEVMIPTISKGVLFPSFKRRVGRAPKSASKQYISKDTKKKGAVNVIVDVTTLMKP